MKKFNLIGLSIVSLTAMLGTNVHAQNFDPYTCKDQPKAVIPAGNTLKISPQLHFFAAWRVNKFDKDLLNQTSLPNKSFHAITNGSVGYYQRILMTFDKTYDATNTTPENVELIKQKNFENSELVKQYGAKKMNQVLAKLKQEGILDEAKKVASLYGVDPVQVLAPILGEKVFNGFLDRDLQTTIASYNLIQLDSSQKKIDHSIQQYDVSGCQSRQNNYFNYLCYTQQIRLNGEDLMMEGLVQKNADVHSRTGTFGLAQFDPIMIYAFNDLVLEKLKNNPKYQDVYTMAQKVTRYGQLKESMEIVLDNKAILHYLAAYAIRTSEIYKETTCFDVSKNAGIMATLYNLGFEYAKAYQLNQRRKQDPSITPQVNFFGWFINQFEGDIRRAIK